MAYKEIKNECLGSGKISVSAYEASRGWVNCSACGKTIKIKANKNYEAMIRRHSRKENK